MKRIYQLLATAFLLMGSVAVTAQNTMTVEQLGRLSRQQSRQQHHNPYSSTYRPLESHAFGTFFVEYNPHTWAVDIKGHDNENYQGISLGGNYFTPFAGGLGFDAGLKLQYLFRQDKNAGVTQKFEMFSATIPVDLVYDWRVSDGFAIDPYVGVYGRYNFMAKSKYTKGSGPAIDYFKDNQVVVAGYPDPMERFQLGFQAGLNFRISDMMTFGGGYWTDFSELLEHTKLHGFNITLGVNF